MIFQPNYGKNMEILLMEVLNPFVVYHFIYRFTG